MSLFKAFTRQLCVQFKVNFYATQLHKSIITRQVMRQQFKVQPNAQGLNFSRQLCEASKDMKPFAALLKTMQKEELLRSANTFVQLKVKNRRLPTDKKMGYKELYALCMDLAKTVYDHKNVAEQRDQLFTVFYILEILAAMDKKDPNVQSLLGITIRDLSYSFRGIESKIMAWRMEKEHLKLGVLLTRYEDYALLMLLGEWHVRMCRINLFQKAIAKYICNIRLPEGSYESAYKLFLRARKAKQRPYIPNLYRLGETCFFMGDYEAACEYFDQIEDLFSDCNEHDKMKIRAWKMSILAKVLSEIDKILKFVLGL